MLDVPTCNPIPLLATEVLGVVKEVPVPIDTTDPFSVTLPETVKGAVRVAL